MSELLLGQSTEYPQQYNPNVLFRVPRQENRDQYGILADDFIGYDVWHAYEFSFLLNNGMPVCGVLKLIYSSNSVYIVESKSLKLYLNSFNMERYGDTKLQGLNQVLAIVKKDLSGLLETAVLVACHEKKEHVFDFKDFEIIEEHVDIENLEITSFKEDESVLSKKEGVTDVEIGSHLLRSNCKVTSQPDWGSVFISLKCNYKVETSDILKFIISLRNENHFHEEICELVFNRLEKHYGPEFLQVACLYTRRGGIDICPVRATDATRLPAGLVSPKILTLPAFRQ